MTSSKREQAGQVTDDRSLRRRARALSRVTGQPYTSVLARLENHESSRPPPVIARDVADLLASRRRDCGWTVHEAASRLGLAPLKVLLLEQAATSAPEDVVERLVDVYSLDSGPRRRLHAAERRRRRALPDGAFSSFDAEHTIHFATTGRRTGLERVKSWIPFVAFGNTLYLVEEIGTRAHWVRNAMTDPAVRAWTKQTSVAATARVVSDPVERELVGELLVRRLPAERFLLEAGLAIAFDAVTGSAGPGNWAPTSKSS